MRKFLIVFIALASFSLTGFVPAAYATEDGNFPVFPTVIEKNITNGEVKVIKVKEERVQSVREAREEKAEEGVTSDESVVTNELGVFSPWGTVKRALSDRGERGEDNVSKGRDDTGLTASVLDSARGLTLWLVIILLVAGLTFAAYRHFVPVADRRRRI